MLERRARAGAPTLRELLEDAGDLAPIRDAYQKLEALTFAIAEKMYGGTDGSGEAPPAASCADDAASATPRRARASTRWPMRAEPDARGATRAGARS